jgi:S1-C subfamily serine protease
MRRYWLPISFVVTVAAGALYFGRLQARLLLLEQRPLVDRTELQTVQTELAEIEKRITDSMTELIALRSIDERSVALDHRLGSVEGALTAAASSLAEQRSKIEMWDKLRDEIGPRALDERIEVFRRGVEEQWKHLDQLAQSAMQKAETTELDVLQFEKGLARDKVRMWRELLGPIVQLMGNETVGSGVLLASEPVPGKDEYRTYLLTAWHVIRDIQSGPENAHIPVPVTVYTPFHRILPETAELLRYDASLDVALLQLNTTRPMDCGAILPSRSRLGLVQTFEQVYAVGCPLGNDPIPTFGEIADTQHTVDGTHYWMISAPTYIGNSGGGIFDAETHELLGIFSKIYTHGTLRPTVVPHMGLVTPLDAIYTWLDSVGFGNIPVMAEDFQAQTASANR